MKNIFFFCFLLAFTPAYGQGAFAELVLRNPKVKIKNKHDIYLQSITIDGSSDIFSTIHHHGVAFESDLVGYRIYFDKRQTIDLYGKYKQRLELKETQFYTDEEQKQNGYGDDVLWVGNTFGCGALRGWNGKEPTMIEKVKTRTQRIVCPGPDSVVVEIIDEKWKQTPSSIPVTLTERFTLHKGRRDVKIDCTFDLDSMTSVATTSVPRLQYSTGIINIKGSRELNNHHGLRGCWGTDWPAGSTDTIGKKRETVGLGIYVPPIYIKEEFTTTDNYGFVVEPIDGKLTYYITFCSDNEEFAGYHSEEAWFDYLNKWLAEIKRRE